MRLGFDIDGIVADMAQVMIDRVNEKFGLSLTTEAFKVHEVRNNSYVDDPDLNKEIISTMFTDVIRNDDAIKEIPLYDDAIRHLYMLQKAGHHLFFITARGKAQKDSTIDWFIKNKVPYDEIHVIGSESKGRYGRSLNLDFFIDDDFPNLEEMYKYKQRWRKGLAIFDRPWNRKIPVDPMRYARLSDWPDVFRHIGIHNR